MLKGLMDALDSWNLAELNSRDKMRTRLLLSEKRGALLKEFNEKKEAMLQEYFDTLESSNQGLSSADKMKMRLLLDERTKESTETLEALAAGKAPPSKTRAKITVTIVVDVIYLIAFIIFAVFICWKC
jgi:sucrose-6-phosphate hydrolase SacC (GH32 family)